MNHLLKEIRHNPLLWLLVFVPVVFAAEHFKPEAHTLLFLLSVLAIVPLAALLSHATESVAAKTGDAVGGLLNATLGNLTELVIALAALRAGQYMLVKASIAGAIVTNSLFLLGASFLLGGLKHHVQEYNRMGARLPACSLPNHGGVVIPRRFRSRLRGGAVLSRVELGPRRVAIVAYALGMLFSLKTPASSSRRGAARPAGAVADRQALGAGRRYCAGRSGERCSSSVQRRRKPSG
jgi:Ca2+:H+ antiporter